MKTTTLRLSITRLAIICLFTFSACDLFEYHPYSGNLEFKNLTAENVAKVKALEAEYATRPFFQFAFISDTQGFFAETADMVEDINRRNVAFVLHGGDLTNYAFTDEFERMHRALAKLQAPYVTVIGNHDCLGDGDKLYRTMYGPLDHTFTFNKNKFIFLNTNYLEFPGGGIPDLEWLEKELKETPDNTKKFVISHVAPYAGDANRSKEQAYASLMRQYNIVFSLHGHTHSFQSGQPYNDGITYVTTAAAVKRNYVLFTVAGNQVTFEKIDF